MTTTTTYDPAYKARKAAKYLDMDYWRLLRLTAEGVIDGLKTPTGRYLYRLSALNSYLDRLAPTN